MNGVCETAVTTKQTTAAAVLKKRPSSLSDDNRHHPNNNQNIALKNSLVFQCLFCSAEIPRIVAYFKHIRKHDMKQIHKCVICKKIVIEDDMFREHLYQKHRDLIDDRKIITSEPIVVKKKNLNQEISVSVPEFIIEEVIKETKIRNSNKKTLSDDQNNNNQVDISENKCFVCSKKFSNFKLLKKHILNKHKEVSMDGFYQSLTKLSYNYYHHPYQQIPVTTAAITGVTPAQLLTGYVIQQEPPPLVPVQQPQQIQQQAPPTANQNHAHTQTPIPAQQPQPVPVQKLANADKNSHDSGGAGYQFKCQFCGELFSKTTKLTQHLRTHTGGKLFQCDICNKSYTQSSALGLHKRRQHYSEVDVTNFKKRTRRPKNSQNNFQNSITFDQIFTCQQCGKQFSKQQSLKQHYLVHNEIQPYRCDVCGETFAQSSKMALHKISHTNKKPYKCEYCSKEFAISDHFRRHLRTHTKEKPFQCNVCQKSFSQPNTLTQHSRIHSGEKPYICSICKKSFSVLNYLNNHLRTHSGEKNEVCTYCHKQFSHKTSLNIHIKSHHYNETN